jgi:rfaE bifunctional protein kinase chain/domain
LGAHCRLISIAGDDATGAALSRLLADGGIEAGLQVDPKRFSTLKLRVVGRNQQLLRIDFEAPPSPLALSLKKAAFLEALPHFDAVVFSDYGKGGLAQVGEMIEAARAAGKAAFVDPKGNDFSRYRGAAALTPNKGEFQAVAGHWQTEAELREKAEAMRAALGLEALLITRSEEGMSLFTADAVLDLPTHAREVYDVSGAGDTVIATLAACRAAGASWEAAARTANHAAGLVVGKLGTATVSPGELSTLLQKEFP